MAAPSSLPFDPVEEAARKWSARWDDADAMAVVTSVMRVQQLLLGRIEAALRPLNLTFARYEALVLLCFSRNGSLPMNKMGQRLMVHPTSITNTIDGLQRLGLVDRTRHPDDRRKWLAAITDHGREVAVATTDVINRERFGTAPLKRAQLDALVEILRDLRAAEDTFERPVPDA